MALKKIEEQASGLSCEYHKLAMIEIQRGHKVICRIETYKDQTARNAGKSPAMVRHFDIVESEINYANNLIAQCYSKVKAAMFSGAEDV